MSEWAYTHWEADEYVIELNNKLIGQTMHKGEAIRMVAWLNNSMPTIEKILLHRVTEENEKLKEEIYRHHLNTAKLLEEVDKLKKMLKGRLGPGETMPGEENDTK